ncbi:hypothetical protein AB0K00_20600 [Dactylosporangium sp. NPDC049525]|uniref:hypothetical protein n=1 Tax=Dactylosporangium sp. NPDC049525 TaxID=3154730 RepID=UPI00343D7835
MNWNEIVIGGLVGWALGDLLSIFEWAALRIVPVAARLWTTDADRREIYSEEWAAVVAERPGGILKLGTAFGFLCGGVLRRLGARLSARLDAERLRMYDDAAALDPILMRALLSPRGGPHTAVLGALKGSLYACLQLKWRVPLYAAFGLYVLIWQISTRQGRESYDPSADPLTYVFDRNARIAEFERRFGTPSLESNSD